ncbi:MAG TPA: PepSY domain-containing protein [Sphingobium sp.]|nr:PepSY domain-containing protein [Sphingobium sp.]
MTALGSACLLAVPALADRPPDAEERTAIETVLKANGFVSWDEIELDDGYWEIDDARTANPSEGKYDLKIDPKSMKIVKRKRDD